VEIAIVGLTVLLIAATWLLYRVAAGLQVKP